MGTAVDAALIADTIQSARGEGCSRDVLGHVQRRYRRPTTADVDPAGYAAVQEILDSSRGYVILGVRRNRITRVPLAKAVRDTRGQGLIAAGDYAAAQASTRILGRHLPPAFSARLRS